MIFRRADKLFLTINAILLTALLAISHQANALTKAECAELSEAGERLMEMRQNGFPMRKIMAQFDSPVLQNIVKAAYDVPRYSSDEYQKRAVEKFGNRLYMDCFE